MQLEKINLGQALNTLANVGVIAGIAFLAIELNQNNDFLELEAKATRTEILLDGWDRITSDPDLVDLMIKDRNQEALTEAEEMRLNAYWMGYFIRREWHYENFSKSDRSFEQVLRLYEAYGSMRRAWNGNSNGSRGAGKDNLSLEFVRFMDERLIAKR